MTDDERRELEARIAVGCEGYEWWEHVNGNGTMLLPQRGEGVAWISAQNASAAGWQKATGDEKRFSDWWRFVPRYTKDLNATVRAADALADRYPESAWDLCRNGDASDRTYDSEVYLCDVGAFAGHADTPAMALSLALDAALGALRGKERAE